MRCKDCGITAQYRVNKSKCWSDHQLCGYCAYVKYPEEYPKSINGVIYKKRRDNKK